MHYGFFLFFQRSDLVKAFTLIESVRYVLDLWNEIYMCHSELWLFKCSTMSESWCFFIQRNGSICIICGLTFTVHHCVNYMSFDCYNIISFFYVLWIFHCLYYMQYIKEMTFPKNVHILWNHHFVCDDTLHIGLPRLDILIFLSKHELHDFKLWYALIIAQVFQWPVWLLLWMFEWGLSDFISVFTNEYSKSQDVIILKPLQVIIYFLL